MVKWLTRIVGIGVIVALIGLLAWSYMPKPVEVEVAQVTRGSFRTEVEEDGKTRVKDRYVVSAPIGGTVARIELHPGDPVEPDEVLARLLPLSSQLLDPRARAGAEARLDAAADAKRQAQASVQRAEAALAEARRELDRTTQLHGRGAATGQQLEEATVAVHLRESELESARFAAKVAGHEEQLARSVLGSIGTKRGSDQMLITSPVRGRVLRVIQQSEGAVNPGAPLLEVGDPAALEVVVDVLTQDAVEIRPEMAAIIDRWGGPQPLHARVRRVEPSAFTRTSALGVEEQRVNVLLDLKDPPSTWSELGDGYSVNARIVTWAQEGVLQCPASALFRKGDGWAVFVVEGGRARERAVRVGHRGPLSVEVLDGLAEGDAVIVHPGELVRAGVSVRTR